jgi:hypothetical protein
MKTQQQTSSRGEALKAAVLDVLDLDAHELALLDEAGRVADRLDALEAALARDGLLLPDRRPHPALVEARQQAITLARLIAALRLPDDIGAAERPQRRGPRGVYSPLRLVGEA